MESGIEKCSILIIRDRKREIRERLKLPYQERIRTLEEKETYNYLGILEADTMNKKEMKKKKN